IRGKKIAAIGDLSSASTRQSIDAAGMAVSPGFIDVHTHTDISLLIDPKAESKIRQGVTTEIGGNCGSSYFPLNGDHATEIKKELQKKYQLKVDWQDLGGFFRRLQQNGIAFNYATLIGHGDIRTCAMGIENRPPSPDEMKRMKTYLRAALEQGALGLSTGLEYTPGSFAETEEIIELCKVVAQYEGVYATHMRNEDVRVQEALEEALQIARLSGVSIQISHLKASQKRNWHKVPKLLQTIQSAHEGGMNIHADRYPYTAYSTSLKMLFPLWAREGEDEDFVGRLKDSGQWRKILPFVKDKIAALGSWASVLITRVKSEERRIFQGKSVEELALQAKQDPYEFVRALLIEEDGQVGMCGFGMSEENTERILAFPLTMVGSDGEAISPHGVLGQTTPHPRYYGTFPRYLGYYVRERKILPLAEAVHRITMLAAQKFGLKGRGRLSKGNYADVVILNPDTIIDKATFVQPHQFPAGIAYVVVNGKIVVANGKHTGALPGEILSH
ncbi:D-aminoacylase, partial [candidate division KSB1 bacterium]|nr:D-aminoacylase [candidate division KSB1 bacterium]